ncbi:MAG: DNA translocase FtsK, partial [Gemmatimonadales bacterium]
PPPPPPPPPPAPTLPRKLRQELIGIAALAAGLFLGLTLLPIQVTGTWGRGLGQGLWRLLGVGAVLLPALGVGWALAAFHRLGPLSALRAAALGGGLVLLLPYGIGIASGPDFPASYAAWSATQRLVGLLPALVASGIQGAVGTAGGALIGAFALSALGILTTGWHPLIVLRQREARSGKREADTTIPRLKRDPLSDPALGGEARSPAEPATLPPAARLPRGWSARAAPVPPGVLIPPVDLLTQPPPDDGEAGAVQIEQMGRKLIETLQTFRVEGSIAGRTVGPVVTQYEVAPGPGVKVGRIAALADDLALAMRAQSLRIVAPIPGKAAVGIEVPNPMPRMVHVRELIEGAEFHRGSRTLPIALGKNLEGAPVVAELAKMPHLLIAGATGSGKSVCINTIITSLLYRYPPKQLRMLMIDPKMVELSIYDATGPDRVRLPHLRHPVVTNNKDAATVLKWAVREMDRRYKLLHANHARNLVDFNRKVEQRKPLKGPRETLATLAGVQGELPLDGEYKEGILPYIVLVVDELADLMMTVQHEVETPLATLAQKARAVGIHIILATQRPSVNVITGLIKANFACRIAFRVSAKVDSRTILDQNGAETLLGNGDMLFLPPGKSELVRIQGCFISTDETERLMGWYAERRDQFEQRGEVNIIEQEERLEEAEERAEQGAEGGGATAGERDPLFRQAAEVCIQNQLGSTSLLQRRMSIGYGRAARIIDQLELAGILGPANGSRPRDVLVGLEDLDEICGAP